MTFNPDDYRQYVDHYDLTEDQKIELLRQVWTIMESFVDRAFGSSSEQILLGTVAENDTRCDHDSVDSRDTFTNEFNIAAGKDAAGRRRS